MPRKRLGIIRTLFRSIIWGLGLLPLGASAMTGGNIVDGNRGPKFYFVVDHIQGYGISVLITITWGLLGCHESGGSGDVSIAAVHPSHPPVLWSRPAWMQWQHLFFLDLVGQWYDGGLQWIQLITEFFWLQGSSQFYPLRLNMPVGLNMEGTPGSQYSLND